MNGIYKFSMVTPRGPIDNYLSVADDGVLVLSGQGRSEARDVVKDGEKLTFNINIGPGPWSFDVSVSDGKLTGTAKHGELDDTAEIIGQLADVTLEAAEAEAANFAGPAGGGDHGGPGGPGGLGGPGGPGGPPPAKPE